MKNQNYGWPAPFGVGHFPIEQFGVLKEGPEKMIADEDRRLSITLCLSGRIFAAFIRDHTSEAITSAPIVASPTATKPTNSIVFFRSWVMFSLFV
jgi:hypothetical protein